MGEWGTGRRDCWPPGTAATAARGGAAAGCAVTAVGPLKTGEGQPPPTAAAGVRQVGGIGEVEISLPVEAAAADAAAGPSPNEFPGVVKKGLLEEMLGNTGKGGGGLEGGCLC